MVAYDKKKSKQNKKLTGNGIYPNWRTLEQFQIYSNVFINKGIKTTFETIYWVCVFSDESDDAV